MALTYNMDVETGSLWLRTTPGELAIKQPYICTEAGLFYARGQFNTARTHKDSYLLFYTLEGEGIIRQNDTDVHLPKQHALLMNCRYPQSYETFNDKWFHYWMHIDGSGISAVEDLLIPNRKIQPVIISDTIAKNGFDTILKNLEKTDAEAIIDNSQAVHSILTHMVKETLNTGTSANQNRTLIKTAAEYIENHYTENIGLEEIIQSTHLSKSYFLQQFRQYMGTTPYNYLLTCRITKAKELLELTDDPISDIAERLGFLDQSAFSVRFRALTGESPLHYRRNAMTRRQV